MVKWVYQDIFDGGFNVIKSMVIWMMLILVYIVGDSYVIVIGNKLVEVIMVSMDFMILLSGNNWQCVFVLGKFVNVSVGVMVGLNLYIVFIDGVLKVLFVIDETIDQVIIIGNLVIFLVIIYIVNQLI